VFGPAQEAGRHARGYGPTVRRPLYLLVVAVQDGGRGRPRLRSARQASGREAGAAGPI